MSLPPDQIEIRELDGFAQTAFHGYKTLNRIQSRIYDTTYHSNENILVISMFLNLYEYLESDHENEYNVANSHKF